MSCQRHGDGLYWRPCPPSMQQYVNQCKGFLLTTRGRPLHGGGTSEHAPTLWANEKVCIISKPMRKLVVFKSVKYPFTYYLRETPSWMWNIWTRPHSLSQSKSLYYPPLWSWYTWRPFPDRLSSLGLASHVASSPPVICSWSRIIQLYRKNKVPFGVQISNIHFPIALHSLSLHLTPLVSKTVKHNLFTHKFYKTVKH